MRRAIAPLPTTLSSTLSSALGYTAVLFFLPPVLGVIALRRVTNYSRRLDPLIRFGAAFLPALFGVLARTRRAPGARAALEGGLTVPAGPFLIMANHVNILDGFLLRGSLPACIPIRALELASHFSWPLYGRAMRLYGNIPIPHNAPRAALGSLSRARRLLAGGTSLLVLPEGHRTRTGELQRFMSGPFRLAREAGVPILPVVLAGAFDRQRVGYPRIAPGTVEVRIGTPLREEQIRTLTVPALKELVHARMESLLKGR
ncbi:MAG: 1-acyl-sn-glycerol-3-phosphate acyltransferase [Spirochaetaceae bacterium]|nr:MAG: 1-acyl-sn-glycerol-3-phosphate acyltransferase [Spirochaetaceae bacterium]